MAFSRLMIQADALTKSFGTTRALTGLDLSVEEGTILAVLGPNGAGKTTAVRILTTLTRPDAGSAVVAGYDVVQNPAEVRRRIGVTGQYATLDELLTGRENLEMIGRLYRLSAHRAQSRASDLLEQFDLVEAGARLVKTYSGGMRRRLDLASSLIASPPVLFLDEPTTGLDPRSRLNMWDLIADLVANGTTILLTTQYLEEADRLANDIAVVDHGHVIARGTADQLKARVGGERLELKIGPGSDLAAAARILTTFGHGSTQVDERERLATVSVDASPGLLSRVVLALNEAEIQVDQSALQRPTLDDVFLALTGREIENDSTSSSLTQEAA
jgi:ABC-2 type transport system ATP-binding protein